LKTRAAAALAIALAAHAALSPTAFAQTPPSPASIEAPDGVPVTFTCDDPAMRIYLAHGEVGAHADPDPFVRVGRTPITIRLAPGTYSIEAESPTSSTGHDRFLVEPNSPMRIEVRPGNASVKTFGSVFIALGVVATLLGVVALVSISASDTHYNRWGIGLPLVIGGPAVGVLGYGMTALGSTDIHVPLQPPGGAPSRASLGPSVVPALSWRF
jgi:hypothetical protein